MAGSLGRSYGLFVLVRTQSICSIVNNGNSNVIERLAKDSLRQPAVYFVSRSYPPVMGGMELHNERVSEELKRLHPTIVMANRKGKRALIPFAIGVVVKVFRKAKAGDVVLFGDLACAFLVMVFERFRPDLHYIAVSHGTDAVWAPHWYQRTLRRRVLPRLDRIIAVSPATAGAVEKRTDFPDRVVVIPNGTDGVKEIWHETARRKLAERFSRDIENRPIILSVGRLIPRKGVLWFIENVMSRLSVEPVFLIVGDGPERGRIVECARRLDMNDRIVLSGTLRGEMRACAFNAANVFVMPNQPIDNGGLEGFGLTILEALSIGLPVVATSLDGIEYATRSGELASIVHPGDSAGFAYAVSRVLEKEREVLESAQKARNIVYREHAWNVVARQYSRTIDDVVVRE